jgi:hypothetical protein
VERQLHNKSGAVTDFYFKTNVAVLASNNLNAALKASYQLMSLIGKLCISAQATRPVMARNVGYYGNGVMPA